jgi:hypothetical protein
MLAVLLLCTPQIAHASPAALEGVTITDLFQKDEDRNGTPDHTVILCSFATESDRVDVFDGAGNMIASDDWQQATDFDDDTWVFDAGDDGLADLIITFSTVGDQHVAYLYDDRTDNGRVAYGVRNGNVTITESRFWSIKVVAEGDWWNGDSTLNRKIHVWVDGPIGMSGLDSDLALNTMSNDGKVDLEMEVRIDASPDMPAYSLARSFPDGTWSVGRTVIRVNVPGSSLPEIKGYVFWPHIGPNLAAPPGPWELAPTLKMDWLSSRFARQGVNHSVIQLTPPEQGWRIYATESLTKDVVNHLDFENPFAYYDLADDHDGRPELIIRNEYSPPGSVGEWVRGQFRPRGALDQAMEFFRYSWNQDNDVYWDYKLSLIGHNVLTNVVSFPDFDVVSIPYDQYPWILTEKMEWDGATFVQVEADAETSSEGVYDWDDIPALSRQFIYGIGDELKVGQSDIRAALRGEYRLEQFLSPRLYFSPVDHKLHLLGAEAGVWNLDDALRVRYEDMDGDGYFDQWQSTRRSPPQGPERTFSDRNPFDEEAVDERVMKSLQLAAGMLIYADSGQVRLVRTVVEPSLFETLPPRDHDEWLVLGQQLDRHAADFAPDGLLEMASQFQGPTTHIQGATLIDFRLTEDGFRFVLKLQPGFQVTDEANQLDVNDLTDGSYLVAYDGEFEVQPLTPAQLTVPQGGITSEPLSPQQGSWATIRVVVHNSGLQDATSVPVAVYAEQGEGEPSLVGEEEVFVPGEGESVLELAWWPVEAGEWTIWVDAETSGAVPAGIDLGTMSSLELDVYPALVEGMFDPFGAPDDQRLTVPIISFLVGGALAAVSCCLIVMIHAKRLPR